MKKLFFAVIILIFVLVFVSFISDEELITGRITVDKFIKSVTHPSQIETSAIVFYVGTIEDASCSYALSLKGDIGYKYFKPMELTDGKDHSQLLTGLKSGDYDINIKCTNKDGFIQTSVSQLSVNLHSNCVVYCQYKSKCQEVADDSCGNLCIRETDGLVCDKDKVCENGSCVDKQLELVEVFEEEPGVVVEKGLLERFISWLKGLVS